jgi:transposase
MLRIELNDIQRQELRLLARREIGRVSERLHFVMLSDIGKSPPEIGMLLGYDAATVRAWLKRYLTDGVAGLDDQPRSGRPCAEEHLDDIVETQVGQPPSVYGYLQAIWSVALLVLHLDQRFRVPTSISRVRQALHRIGMSWHRPKLCPAHRPDPQRQAKEILLAQALADTRATVVAVDECDCHLLAVVRAMWQHIGEQLRLPTPGQNRRRSIFGGLNLRTGQWHYQLSAHKRTADFTAFLSLLLIAYPIGTICVVADNASIHHSVTLCHWLTLHPRIQMIYLPTYAGHLLNPVEKVWWQLKRFIAANCNFHSLPELDASIMRCLDAFTPASLLQLCNSDVVRRARLPQQSNVYETSSH